MRSSRRPQGSSLAPASGEGAQVPLGGLAVQVKLRAGADGRAAEHHGDDAGPASPGAAARPRRRGRVHGRGRRHDWRPRRKRGVRGGPGMLSGQATWCRSRVPDPTDKLARTVEVIAPAGFEAFFEELAAVSGDARQPQQRRADLAPSTGSALHRTGARPESEAPPEADRRVTVIRSARKGPRKCRSRPFSAAGSERASRIGRSERLCDVVENRGPPAPIRRYGAFPRLLAVLRRLLSGGMA
jgi:hypothetical protein